MTRTVSRQLTHNVTLSFPSPNTHNSLVSYYIFLPYFLMLHSILHLLILLFYRSQYPFIHNFLMLISLVQLLMQLSRSNISFPSPTSNVTLPLFNISCPSSTFQGSLSLPFNVILSSHTEILFSLILLNNCFSLLS